MVPMCVQVNENSKISILFSRPDQENALLFTECLQLAVLVKVNQPDRKLESCP